ncbi:Peptidase dimerisation domain-containing protein [Lentibacillus halodurans]|uniref:Peptidase dimerisation domain-containing protein n=1 Tax=Lentibacillus halodurans TaxID=237679 RepID=A0A1I0YD59_9BACI|nr:M20 family metallopeptidase [Lentibacillus halodurans]SFB10440.1 Peptidase dimerisation domain-containing protein [Lentibacillus halodurans]
MTKLKDNDVFHKLKGLDPVLHDTVLSIYEELVQIRRDFRKHPELSFQEYRTASIVGDYLRRWGYDVEEEVGDTGVIGLLQGEEEGKVFGLRADMDALPMNDEIEQDYKSINEGAAHTCGHDMHMANLLGVAKVFSILGLKKGTLKLIFQPAEEIGVGAKRMIDQGALENPKMDMMAGLHVHPTVGVGKFSISASTYSGAAADFFQLDVHGKGGHAAYPHLTVDPVTITSQILVAFQQIVSRKVNPIDSAVISVGNINGGTKNNIIPEKVTVKGTVRTLDPEVRELVSSHMKKIASSIAESYGGSCDLQYNYGPPSIKIDEDAKQLFIESAIELFGKETIKYSQPSMGGEDFSSFSQEVPSFFFRLGTNSGKSTAYSNHNPKFNVDERALLYGVTILTHLTDKFLNKEAF